MFESWPGEKLLTKVWETFDKGVSGALSPWQIRREARARAEARRDELLLLAQAESDVAKIRAGEAVLSADGRLLLSPGKRAQVVEGSVEAEDQEVAASPLYLIRRQQEQDSAAREMRRSITLRKMAIFAEEEAENHKDEPVSDEPVDVDWFARWRNCAEDVNDEDMQRLWGRVLAGEVKQPKTYSLHALDMLSRMSKADAELVAKLANLDIGGAILKIDGDYYNEIGIPFDKLLYLDDIGVLNGVIGIGGLSKQYVVKEYEPPQSNKQYCAVPIKIVVILFVFADKKIENLSLPVYTISQPARQLLRLVTPSVDVSYLREVAKVVKKMDFESASYGPMKTLDPEGNQYQFRLDGLIELVV